ncbi:sugar transporter [Vibrio viridaestus]|uniref:Sugar transporter n=1 Tax=Vibrio viridaestus TaxID=2487322 RepID=A0A3N9TIF4_9VIBR|nr:sugar transporter [Vibrio viridaestus]RQW64088.1 sugar transporter [Vibrio viridaestus]
MSSASSQIVSSSRMTQNSQVIILAIAGFIFNTTEFVPVGLLTDMANDLNLPLSQLGWMLTIYAWVVASISLPLIIVTRKLERKRLMCGVFSLFILSHIMTFFAWSFSSLLISRMGVAISHALFWSMAANLAVRLVPVERKPFALSMMVSGTSLAMIMGVPLGRVIGQAFGWRVAFLVIAILACIAVILLMRLLPSMPSIFKGSIKQISQLFKNRFLLILYGFTFLMFVSHFTTYSYIEPFLARVGKYNDNEVTFYLLLFGLAALIGSFSFSQLCRFLSIKLRFVLFSCCVILSMLLFPTLVSHADGLIAAILVWGATRIMMMLTLQSTVLSTNEHGGDFVMAVYSSIINIGIGGGALIGGKVISEMGLVNLPYVSTAISAMALIVLWKILQELRVSQS